MKSFRLIAVSAVVLALAPACGKVGDASTATAEPVTAPAPEPSPVPAPPKAGGLTITGIAFVDNSVTGMGSKAELPANAKIYPGGATVTGRDGCPTTQYRTDGLIVAVLDYSGPPTNASLTLTMHLASGGNIERAPYYLDLNPGRTLQVLGPVFDNGSYDLKAEWGFAGPNRSSTSSSFRLQRSCPGAQ
jgi:hypothetical protein